MNTTVSGNLVRGTNNITGVSVIIDKTVMPATDFPKSGFPVIYCAKFETETWFGLPAVYVDIGIVIFVIGFTDMNRVTSDMNECTSCLFECEV